jgi:hypothetical protein
MNRFPTSSSPASLILLLTLATGAATPARRTAEADRMANVPPPGTCDVPEARQFDFWIGDWEVREPGGALAGTNLVERVYGGCALRENWASADGKQHGTSLNHYDPAARRWHQTWVDDTGGFLLLDGTFTDGTMTLEGNRPSPDGTVVRHRIAWSRVGDDPDRVRQLWEASRDGGKSWKVVFDGLYGRRGARPAGR